MTDGTHSLPVVNPQVAGPAEGRECGSCSMCCKLFPIPEIGKPADTWCTNFAKHRGCTIWQHRPAVCRVFWCGWAQGMGPARIEEGRPDHAGFIVHGATDGSNALCVLFDSATVVPPAWLDEAVDAANLAGREIRIQIASTGEGWAYPPYAIREVMRDAAEKIAAQPEESRLKLLK